MRGAILRGLAIAMLAAFALAGGTSAQVRGKLPAIDLSKPLDERGYVLGDIVLGDEDAPVTIIEYASLTCPHCASFHNNTFPQVKKKYIETGKVRFILREIYFDGEGLLAARFARCAGEAGYYPLVDRYFSTQKTWSNASDIPRALYQTAVRAGVPTARLKICIQDREFAVSLTETFKTVSDRDSITSTPTFLINGERVEGAVGYREISEVIEKALAG